MCVYTCKCVCVMFGRVSYPDLRLINVLTTPTYRVYNTVVCMGRIKEPFGTKYKP